MSQQTRTKLGQHGYWRLTFRPTVYEARRFGLADLEELVRSAIVELRGWSFPALERDTIHRLADHIAGSVDWVDHIESWRMYKSGQFLLLRALPEDWSQAARSFYGMGPDIAPGSHLDLHNVLFTLTEFWLFAARVVEKGALGPQVVVEVRLAKPGDRQLQHFVPGRSRLLPGRRSAPELGDLSWKDTLDSEELIARATDYALNQTLSIFEYFRWQPTRASLAEEQDRLIQRRP